MLGRRNPPPGRRTGHRGFALVEVLVGMLLFTIGILGMMSLAAIMTTAQTASMFRSDAAALAADIVGQMWADAPGNRPLYASTEVQCSYLPCAQWVQKVGASLPQGRARLDWEASTGTVTVSVRWTQPTEGEHAYVTRTSIR